MSRILSEHFKRNGSPKRRFRTKAEAVEFGRKHNQNPYKCSFCHFWHVGGRWDRNRPEPAAWVEKEQRFAKTLRDNAESFERLAREELLRIAEGKP